MYPKTLGIAKALCSVRSMENALSRMANVYRVPMKIAKAVYTANTREGVPLLQKVPALLVPDKIVSHLLIVKKEDIVR